MQKTILEIEKVSHTNFFLKILFNNFSSSKHAPAELIKSAITGPSTIPFAIIICEIGTSHQLSPSN